MSLNENTKWAEAAREMFEEAKDSGDFSLAGAIMQDALDNGYKVDSWKEELLKAEKDYQAEYAE